MESHFDGDWQADNDGQTVWVMLVNDFLAEKVDEQGFETRVKK